DLHFTDRSSLEFLHAFLPFLPRERILILATMAPPGELPVATGSAIDALLHWPGTSLLSARPMTEDELGEFARYLMNGRDPDRNAVLRWFSQTDGNPLFVEHLVRAAAGSDVGDARPAAAQDLDDLLRRTVRGLRDVEKRTLVYGAVLGREFTFPVLARASGESEETVTEAID